MTSSQLTPVSAVIPCYNCSETIGRAVASIAEQTFRPIEVILVDDASQDGTFAMLESLKNQYGEWIRLVKLHKNVGAASARNAGWRLATQPYIAFLDSDDAWHLRKIEIQYCYMKDNPDVTVSGHLCRELSKYDANMLNWTPELKFVRKISWVMLLLRNYFVTPSVMIKKDIPFQFFDGKRHVDDHLLWLEVVSAGLLAVRLDIELAAVFKPMYGASGLSSNMWLMEKSELENYQLLYQQGRIGILQCIFLQCFSFAKFIRRLIVVNIIRRILKRK